MCVFEIEPNIAIPQNTYIVPYPHLIAYFKSKETFTATDFVVGAHMVYGWMPTIVHLRQQPSFGFDNGAELLTKAKKEGTLDNNQITALKGLINNSIVGASKLLHFVAPVSFAMWDRNVFAFLQAYVQFHGGLNVANYLNYLHLLNKLREDRQFPDFHRSVNEKIGYYVSELRALEIVMFLGGQACRHEA